MSKITGALKKKWGPLPAWAWLLGGGLLYYYYRKYSSTSASGTGTGSVAQTPTTPQPGQVLEPGESYYDPNTGSLSTAPGGSSGGGIGDITGTSLDPNALAAAIAGALAPDLTNTGDNGGTTTQNPETAQPGVAAGTTSNGGSKGKPKLTAKGAVYAPFGHNKPVARPGFTIRGLGRGFWEYVPKRTAKSKGQHNATNKTSKPPTSGQRRTRSAATTRHTTGGRTTARAAASSPAHSVTVTRSTSARQQPSRARQRPRTPAVTQVVSQRRPASTPRPSPTRQEGGVAPRPSAPPPRTVRAPAPSKPKPKPKPRKG